MKVILYVLLLCFQVAVVCSKFERMRLSLDKILENKRIEKHQLRNVVALKLFNKINNIKSDSCFIHIPRTGGHILRKMAKKTGVKLKVWHSNDVPPPSHCGCFTNIRNPIKRYVSEWKFYGMKKFADGKKVFGWFPKNGTPKNFEDYVKDTSTHNSMTKILSGCQMYTNCIVDESTVSFILDRIKSGCLNVLETTKLPIQGHRAWYMGLKSWDSLAEKANELDMKLYEGIKDILFLKK